MTTFKTVLAFVTATLWSLQANAEEPEENSISLTAVELFDLADRARNAGDYATAEEAYRALIQDPDPELGTEARFRLARMYVDRMGRPREAAVLLRRILDDKPEAAPVRLELARVLAQLGDYEAARRELRAVQATGVPPEVEQRLRFFANALSATKRYGGSIDVAMAPSTNINRATRADALETVIGDFELSEDAKEQSGIGLSAKGQAYARLPLSSRSDLLVRGNFAADVYRKSRFDDLSFSLQAGPQWNSGSDRIALAVAVGLRWYGLEPYSSSYGINGNWQHPLSARSQLRLDGGVLVEENKRNNLQDGPRYTLAATIDHAFNARRGGGLQLHARREATRDPGYSNLSGGVGAYAYQELGRTTAVLNVSFRHLEADARLSLYPHRRIDHNVNVGLSGTFRSLSVRTFAPVVRLSYERNWSTIEIYDYDRLGAEFGIAAAF